MGQIKLLIEFCFSVLNIPLQFFGYSFTLANILIYVILGVLILHIIYRLFS